METLLRYMSKGSWIVLAVILLWALAFLPIMSWQFLKENIWYKHGDLLGADQTKVQVDFLGWRVNDLIRQVAGSAIGLLAISFIHLSVRFERLKRRLEELERGIAPGGMLPASAAGVHRKGGMATL
jgi:hypothetical protein